MIIWRIFAANKQRNTNLKTYMDMKNLKTLLTMAIVALMSLSFTSCDEDADIGDTLYGTWKGYMDIGLTYGDHYYASTTSEITFVPSNSYSDHGKGYWIDRYSNAPWNYVANHIEWAVSNGVINIHFIEENSYATIYNYSLDDDYFYGTVECGNSSADFRLVKTASPNEWNYDWYDPDDWYDSWGYGWAKPHQGTFDDTRASSSDSDSLKYLRRVVNYKNK